MRYSTASFIRRLTWPFRDSENIVWFPGHRISAVGIMYARLATTVLIPGFLSIISYGNICNGIDSRIYDHPAGSNTSSTTATATALS